MGLVVLTSQNTELLSAKRTRAPISKGDNLGKEGGEILVLLLTFFSFDLGASIVSFLTHGSMSSFLLRTV